MRPLAKAGIVVVFVASCMPAPERNSASVSRIVVDASDASVSLPDGSADAEDSVGARYNRREWVITRGNGTLVFEAPGDAECVPLPEKRPSDFMLILVQRRGEPGDWTYFGLAEKSPCRFAWSMPWMDPPPAACKTIDRQALDELYAELRALSPHTIRSRRLTDYVSPHRGGWSIHWRWAQVECEVSDILDMEVESQDRSRFDAAQNLVRKAYQAP